MRDFLVTDDSDPVRGRPVAEFREHSPKAKMLVAASEMDVDRRRTGPD
jgi:hypothetical protein